MLDINGGATKLLCWEGIVFVIVFWQLFIYHDPSLDLSYLEIVVACI